MVFFTIQLFGLSLKIYFEMLLSANSISPNILKYSSIQSIIYTTKIEYLLKDRTPPRWPPL